MDKFILDQRIHPILRNVKLLLLHIREKLFGFNSNEIQNIRKLKDSKKGKSCFIIGNGPSLRLQDLDTLQEKNIDSFGANSITDIFVRTKWRPTYYSIMDTTFLFKGNKDITPQLQHDLIKENGITRAFYTDVLKGYIKTDNVACFLTTHYSPMFSKRFLPFQKDISDYINDLGSVTHFNIQIATYLGYTKIYLYGMDNNYTKYLDVDGKFKVNNQIESHFEGISKIAVDEHINTAPRDAKSAYKIGGFADKRKNDIGYSECLRYANSHGIKILNATRGGKLDVFERINFDDIF